ncbi:MAG TPA: hypothetical protein VFH26_02150 [Gemmatimonadales bacterium]|nr:hypothetical protein [Gemmatimonadales bacterium]
MYAVLYTSFLGFALFTAPALAAQSANAGKEDPDQSVQGAGSLPAGWSARPDKEGQAANIKFVTMEPGYHLTLGPATILYRQKDNAKGPFHTLAKFSQTKKLKHSEGYGLFMGGQSLAGKDQKYTYFLVRDDGSYLIKRRDGENTSDVSKGWTKHPAVKTDPEGKPTNLLEIDAKQNPNRIDFKVNGQTVHSTPATKMNIKGIVGLRVNHNLDVHIQDFDLHQ